MNILYINHYAGSIHHGMEYRPYYLAREWVKLGHNVIIIASNLSHIRTKNIEMSDSEEYKLEYIDGVRYIWCKTIPYDSNGIKRVINIFSFLYKVNKLIPAIINGTQYQGIKFDIPDMVIASSTYPFDNWLTNKIAKKTQAKMIYEVHDLWPLTPMELGGMSKYHPFIYSMQKAEDFGYRNADKVVSLLPLAYTYMSDHGMALDKFIYISNGVSVSDWQNDSQVLDTKLDQQIDEFKQQYSFLIGYAGGMGESNALNYLMDAIKKVTNPNIGFVLVGNGSERNSLIEKIKDQKNVLFLDRINKNQVPDFLSKMNALYIGWHKLSIYRFGVCPNKLFDYMLAGKPVIHSISAGNDLVQEAKCGITVEAENIGEIAEAIDEMAQKSQEELIAMGENGREFVLKHHDYKVLATRFIDECS